MKINAKGFGTIEGVLIVVVVVLLGVIGWMVYKNNNKPAANSNAQTAAPSAPAKTTQTTTTPNQPTVSYVTVKEWGVKVPQTPQGNIISYQISTYDKNMTDFVSSEQKALGGSCGSYSFARYHILQTEEGYKSNDEITQNKMNYAAENNLLIKANNKNYYIFGDMTGGDCTGTAKEGSSTSQQEATANKDLLESLKGLVKAN